VYCQQNSNEGETEAWKLGQERRYEREHRIVRYSQLVKKAREKKKVKRL